MGKISENHGSAEFHVTPSPSTTANGECQHVQDDLGLSEHCQLQLDA